MGVLRNALKHRPTGCAGVPSVRPLTGARTGSRVARLRATRVPAAIRRKAPVWFGTGCAGVPAGIRRKAPVWLSAAMLTAIVAASLHAQSGVPDGYELVYSQDFTEASALDDFTFSDQRAWRYGEGDWRGYLDLKGGSNYKPKHRSPLNIALIDNLLLADFVLEAEAWQTGREYGHRDLSLFFGFEGPNRYYYAHLATEPDDRAHNIFLVDNADRAPMGTIPEEGVDWGRGWKRVRVERQDGSLRVYFDGERQPTVEADRDPLGWGRVGFGSFDDTGRFSKIRIWAPETRKATKPGFN